MAFIDKKDPVVLNIKLTSKGREQLSRGLLDFKYFAIGDSEIDYTFNNCVEAVDNEYTPFYSQILRPADKNPSLLSFVKKSISDTGYNEISSIPITVTPVTNIVQSLGFFYENGGSGFTFITDTDHIKQPDATIRILNITGGTKLLLQRSPSYLANINEPAEGDYLMIKWTTPYGEDTTGNIVSIYDPKPFLMYKITNIISGKLSTDNLIINVDRDLPNFSGLTGGLIGEFAGALIFYNYINFTGDTVYNQYSTDFLNESVLTFLENCQCPTVTFPFWNLSIIFTDEIAGVTGNTIDGHKKYVNFNSRVYGGFVSYIQNQSPIYKKLGVIHYTNSSPSNTYAEEFRMDDPTKLPKVWIPTVMWHKKSEKTLGLRLGAIGSVKSLSGLTTPYYDLADEDGNIVGKIFNNLKIFVIEDQELLFAMSYKSNRSWTLPNYTVGVNDNITAGCVPCVVIYLVDPTPPSKINGSDGSIYIHDINGHIPGAMLILSISGESGMVFFNTLTNDMITNGVHVTGLTAGIYNINFYNDGAVNCPTGSTVISGLTSILEIYDTGSTPSMLNLDFKITQVNNNQYTPQISDIGTPYGTEPKYTYSSEPYFTMPDTGSTSWKTSNIITLPPIPKIKYKLYVLDVNNDHSVIQWMSKGYITVPLPILNTTITTSKTTTTLGTFIMVSNYATPGYVHINGYADIEVSIFKQGSAPVIWEKTTGTNMKYMLVTEGTGIYNVAIRVRKDDIDNIIIEENKYSNTITID
jgi:hypothetical protein